MISVERSVEAWEEVQRHGMDLADKLTQGFTELIQSHITPPSFSWPNPTTPNLFRLVELPPQNFTKPDFGLYVENSAINGVTAIFDIGNKIGQVGAGLGACVTGVVQQAFRRFPVPFRRYENVVLPIGMEEDLGSRTNLGIGLREDFGSLKDFVVPENDCTADSEGGSDEEEGFSISSKALKLFGHSKGTINLTSTYNSGTGNTESSLVARGDLWRVEASQGSSTSGNGTSPFFLVQLGPVLFVRDSTLLLPIHLSKQHLLWYGYDRKNGLHSLCPAVWSKHRRWLLMSTICLNPLACSFMDLQFPNGQVTYVSGEGFSTSAFMQLWGGLLQAQGQYPGEMRFSFSMKNKCGTRVTPAFQWPDKSFALGMEQALAWRRSGLILRPTLQFSLCPTFGGSNPGLRMEVTHSVREELSLVCGCALLSANPSAFASVSVGRSKWNGNVGNMGIVVKVETPVRRNYGRRPPWSLVVQLNSGVEF
ncbi:hypothetical protein M569_17341 [Genlisea aurea]|uniref:Uncharacterized protein n=1 Tax=Genlisea aurea TaxID=192259 RepID=S8BZ89_9LAMI|nr:hypothetical protein M569_17341 [Genlisea aurea]